MNPGRLNLRRAADYLLDYLETADFPDALKGRVVREKEKRLLESRIGRPGPWAVNGLSDSELKALSTFRSNGSRIPSSDRSLKMWKRSRKERIDEKRKRARQAKEALSGYIRVSPIPIEGVTVKVGHSHKTVGKVLHWTLILFELDGPIPFIEIRILKGDAVMSYKISNRFTPLNVSEKQKQAFARNIENLRILEQYIKSIRKEAIAYREFLRTREQTGRPPKELDALLSPYHVRDRLGNVIEKIDINTYLKRFKNFKTWNYETETETDIRHTGQGVIR